MPTLELSSRIAGANIERTVLNIDGSVSYLVLNDNSNRWVMSGSMPAWFGRLRYARQLRAMRAA